MHIDIHYEKKGRKKKKMDMGSECFYAFYITIIHQYFTYCHLIQDNNC